MRKLPRIVRFGQVIATAKVVRTDAAGLPVECELRGVTLLWSAGIGRWVSVPA